MAASKKGGSLTVKATEILESLGSNHPEVGLLANGSAGSWDVCIDETISGADRWFLEMDGPLACLRFEIPSPKIIGTTLLFLESRRTGDWSESKDTLVLGSVPTTPVTLVRDDEYSDRFFFVMGGDPSPSVRLSIAGKDLAGIIEALRQIQGDLQEE